MPLYRVPPPAPKPVPAPMSITVVGSIAYDAVKTPFGERERMLGGAAVHFALAASFFDRVRVVGPVGDDFGEAELDVLRGRGVNISDIERIAITAGDFPGTKRTDSGPVRPRALLVAAAERRHGLQPREYLPERPIRSNS